MKVKRKKTLIMAVTNDLVTDNRVHKIALTLTGMGFDVTLAGRTYPSGKIKIERAYRTRRFSLWFNKGPLFYANYNIRLFFYLIFKRFDVIVSNDLDTLAACYCASQLTGNPIVYDSHEYYTEVPELVNRPRVKRIWEQIEKQIVPKLTYCYTVCQSIADIYNEKYNTSFSVVRNVPSLIDYKLDNEVIVPPFSLNKPVVIYQGAVNLGRGIEEAILAMHHVENAILVVIGSGDHLELCRKIVLDEGLSSKVIITGRVPFSDLQKFTRFASIGLSVEKDMGLNYRYALPNKLFDYIQSEVPVLASSLPEIKRIVEGYGVGITIEETTPELIAKNLNMMLKSNGSIASWKKNCSIAKEELCWENEEKILISLYAQLQK
jgi:glycosyltransferase involved in cell wall biosynthesis